MRTFLRQLTAVFLAACAMSATLPARSQYTSDIDIYSGAPSELDMPNVLILVDNGANWGPYFNAEKAALKNTFGSLPADKFRVGMMMFSHTNPEGSYVLSGIRKLDADYQPKLSGLVQSLSIEPAPKKGHKVNNVAPSLALAEAWRYFAGMKPVSGGAGAVKTDYAGNSNSDALEAERKIYATPGNALGTGGSGDYLNLFARDNCAPNYIIFLSNGPGTNSENGPASTALSNAYTDRGQTRPPDIRISPSKFESTMADEWARFMKDSPQRITTFTVDLPKKDGNEAGWTALLKSVAAASGGEYFRVDGASEAELGARIQEVLADIFNQIQAVNSVFASASLPVSVNARGTYLNQVFMGMFRPDGDGRPRWRGNLKQFRFGYDPSTDALSLVDIHGKEAISGATGFISPKANSFWSHDSNYWVNQPLGTPPSASDAPDGEVVEKGGVAQGIREAFASSQAERKILTCIGCAANTNLATDPASQIGAVAASDLGAATAGERDALVAWIRGTDNAGGELGPGDGVTVRPSVHGDVLHSRPAVVNYGGSTGVIVFYGANDGLLRAVNGNQSGPGAGQELWGFVAQEHLGKFKRLRDNTPNVRLSTTLMPSPATSADPKPRDYFADGPIGIYQKVVDGVAEKVYLYSAMRRGGRLLYALDVSNPAQPRFLWKKTAATLPILGQTWSEPKVARLRGHANPVLVMGAGYDSAAEDVSPPGTTTMGNAVLVLDAFNGTLLKQFATERSVAADVSLIDADYDGYVDRAYAVDLGGNVWRLDFETADSTAQADWSHHKVADLTADGEVRKFFYPPDVVLTRSFAALMLASGDREKPLAGTSSDRFFMLRDTHAAKGKPAGDAAPIALADLGRIGEDGADYAKGCYHPFSTAGEKAVNAPVTAAGITYFSTNQPTPPSPGMCVSNLGRAKVYSAPLFCKTLEGKDLQGGGLPPSPVVGVVTVTYTSQETGEEASKEVPFIIGAPNEKNSGIEGSKVKPTITPTRKRKYWYLENAR